MVLPLRRGLHLGEARGLVRGAGQGAGQQVQAGQPVAQQVEGDGGEVRGRGQQRQPGQGVGQQGGGAVLGPAPGLASLQRVKFIVYREARVRRLLLDEAG